MQVKLYVKDGFVALECEGILPEPPKKIVFNRTSRIFTMHFERSGRKVDIDCPIDDEMAGAIQNFSVCGIGCYHEGEPLSTALVAFEQVYG